MLQKRFTLDYGRKSAGSRPVEDSDVFVPRFYLDLLIIVGQPLKAITRRPTSFFDNINFSFKSWRASYSAKHIHGLSFDMEHRTFRIATAASREAWYIVMHPVARAPEELLSRGECRKRREKSAESSALKPHHAHLLASYIKEIFLEGELLGEGVEPSWKLGGTQSANMTGNKWTIFQEQFMSRWPDYVERHREDLFWLENQPAFHAYDYGANIEITVTEEILSIPQETILRPRDDDSDSESSFHASSIQGEGDADEDVDEDVDKQATQDTSLFTDNLAKLKTDLEQKYIPAHIETVTYALAVDIHCADAAQETRTLLTNRNQLLEQYRHERDFTFYPLAFHPAYGNFSSPQPPTFLVDNLLAAMQDNMSYQHNGIKVLDCGYFQAYSNIKRSIRHGPNDLLATKGIATAALTLQNRNQNLPAWIIAKRERLLQRLQGQQSPDDPATSQPFAREQRRIEDAITVDECAFRIEQVLSIQVSKLNHQSFVTVLKPIFQLIRFFSKERSVFKHLFHSFSPSIYPGILASFAKLFSRAIDHMHTQFRAGGSKGLNVALAEGLAAVDRLGSYCFTGFPKSLIGSVMGPLQTLESVQQGGWPFINPAVLNFCGKGELQLAKWPRHKNGRPILMHIASIAFHYGPEMAAGCATETWFTELGGLQVQGPASAARFLEEVFRDIWKPEMIAFVTAQFRRAVNKGSQRQEISHSQGALQLATDREEQLKRWAKVENPFTWEYVLVPPSPCMPIPLTLVL